MFTLYANYMQTALKYMPNEVSRKKVLWVYL